MRVGVQVILLCLLSASTALAEKLTFHPMEQFIVKPGKELWPPDQSAKTLAKCAGYTAFEDDAEIGNLYMCFALNYSANPEALKQIAQSAF